jgi:hypothetical protein
VVFSNGILREAVDPKGRALIEAAWMLSSACYSIIAAINVVNGGSGYLPLNFGGTEAQAVTVLITTGYVTNIFYR